MQSSHFDNNPNINYFSTASAINSIDQILNKGSWNLYEKYIWEKSPQYYAQDIMNYNDGVVAQQTFPQDKGESKIVLQHKWAMEKEPFPVELDHNARISVKIEYKATSQNELNNDDTQSIQSNLSLKSSQIFGFKLTAKKQSQPSLEASQIIQRQSKTLNNNFFKGDEVVKLKEEKRPVTPDSDIERLREKREIKDKEGNTKKQNDQKQKDQEKAFEDKKQGLAKQLKNKKFTYEYDGQIMYLKPPGRFGQEGQSVIPEQQGLEFKNPNKKPGEIVRTLNDDNQKPTTLISIQQNKKKKKSEIFVTQEFHKQPPLVEILRPNSGVNIVFQNGYKKEGEKNQNDQRMRKDEYNKMIENQPNRPVPQYILDEKQNKQLLALPMSDYEKDLRQKIGLMRPMTASGVDQQYPQTTKAGGMKDYFKVKQTVQVHEKEQFLNMMKAEQPLSKLQTAKGPGGVSFISLRKSQQDENQLNDEDQKYEQENEYQLQQELQLAKKDQKKQPFNNFDRINTYKKREIGNKGDVKEKSYDLGVQYGTKKQQTNKQEQQQQILENDSKLHFKVKKFDKEIIEDPNWGHEIQMGLIVNQKQNSRPTSYKITKSNVIRAQSAKNFNIKKPQSAKQTGNKITASTKPTEGNLNTKVDTQNNQQPEKQILRVQSSKKL